ncbi:MAG: MASE1 domain-containing protein, partial [Deltaproteobacteria bacterium]|nr:MASE1 domain-containing protein [Deltaproteobacteria bacterium]
MKREPMVYAGKLVLLAVVYFIAAKLGLRLAFVHASATAVWPPTGITLAALLIMGYRVWPGIFLGAYFANLMTAGTVATSLGIATGNTLEGIVGAYLVHRFAGGRTPFDRAQDVFRFAFFAAVVSTMVSATIGVTSLSLGGFAEWVQFGSIWFTWWLGDMGGNLVVAPVLLLWSVKSRLRFDWKRWGEMAVLMALLVVLGLMVFCDYGTTNMFTMALVRFILVPLLIWIALRFSQREAATAVMILASFAVWGTLHELGPFAALNPNDSLLTLQAYLGVTSIMAITIAANVDERRDAEEELRVANEELEDRVVRRTTELVRAAEKFRNLLESAPDAMVIVNKDGEIILINTQTKKLFGFEENELLGK